MCGRYALADYDPDELVYQFERQYSPQVDNSDDHQDEPPSVEPDEPSEEQSTEPDQSGESAGDVTGQTEAGESDAPGPNVGLSSGTDRTVRWASEAARMAYRRRYNVSSCARH